MKSFRDVISIKSKKKEECINITNMVEKIVERSGIKDGFVLIFPLHTSCGVFINDSDFNITKDWMKIARKIIPEDDKYLHNEVDYKKNADGHLKGILTGHHVIIPITDGKLDLGTYHTIYYYETDGMREKEVLIKIIGE